MGYETRVDFERNAAVGRANTSICNPRGSRGRHSKVRLISDFRASGVNAVASASDTDVLQGSDVPLATVAWYLDRCAGAMLQAFSVDYSHAYKNIPMRRDQEEFATIVLTPPEGRRNRAAYYPAFRLIACPR